MGKVDGKKLKIMLRMSASRIRLHNNKAEQAIKAQRREISKLLEKDSFEQGRIKVEFLIQNERVHEAAEIVALFCELLVARMPLLEELRDHPPSELLEAVSTVLFSAKRLGDIKDLADAVKQFTRAYGREFVEAATVNVAGHVNPKVYSRLVYSTPDATSILDRLENIAKEFNVNWEAPESFISSISASFDAVSSPESLPKPEEAVRSQAEDPPASSSRSVSAAAGRPMGGVGAQLARPQGSTYVQVVDVARSSPNVETIFSGDAIVAVDGLSVEAASVADTANLLRGEPGTGVQVTVLRDGTNHVVLDLVRYLPKREGATEDNDGFSFPSSSAHVPGKPVSDRRDEDQQSASFSREANIDDLERRLAMLSSSTGNEPADQLSHTPNAPDAEGDISANLEERFRRLRDG